MGVRVRVRAGARLRVRVRLRLRQLEHLSRSHLRHELLELRRGAALAAVLGVERREVEVVLDHLVDDVRDVVRLHHPVRLVEHRLDVAAQRARRREAVRAHVGHARDGVLLAHLLDEVVRADAQVGVHGARALVDEVEARAVLLGQAAELAEHVGEVERVAIEADHAPVELGLAHVPQPDEEGLDRAAGLHVEGHHADVDLRVLLREAERRLVLRIERLRDHQPHDVAQPRLQVIEQVEQHGSANDLDERLRKGVAGLAKRLAATAHRDEDVERGLVSQLQAWARGARDRPVGATLGAAAGSAR